MANPNSPFGFKPLGVLGDTPITGALGNAKIAYGNSTAIYRGDPLVRLNTGYVTAWSTAVAPGLVVGIFWGVKYASTALGRTTQNTFWPGNDATTDATCYFIRCAGSPSPLFLVQSTGSSPVTLANVGQNISPVIGTGSIKGTYGMSGASVGYSTIGNTALEFKIEGLWSDFAPAGTPGIDDTLANNLVVVRANSFSETGV